MFQEVLFTLKSLFLCIAKKTSRMLTNLQHKFSTECKISSVLVDLGFLYLSWYFPSLNTIHTCTPFIFSCLYGTLIWPPNTGIIRSSKVCLICTLTNEWKQAVSSFFQFFPFFFNKLILDCPTLRTGTSNNSTKVALSTDELPRNQSSGAAKGTYCT